jgi:hypothetical protein
LNGNKADIGGAVFYEFCYAKKIGPETQAKKQEGKPVSLVMGVDAGLNFPPL